VVYTFKSPLFSYRVCGNVRKMVACHVIRLNVIFAVNADFLERRGIVAKSMAIKNAHIGIPTLKSSQCSEPKTSWKCCGRWNY